MQVPWKTRLAAAAVFFALFGVPLVGLLPSGQEETLALTAAAAPAVTTWTLSLKDLGDEAYTLKTVRTERHYAFSRPKNWKIMPGSKIRLSFQHSPALLPERSGLNVLVNNRILKTIALGKNNVTPTTIDVALPPDVLKDRNDLAFQVDQHYTYKCEDPFSPELWTTLLPETQLQLQYQSVAVLPNLGQFPFPLFDDLGYGDTQTAFVLPANLSDESLSAAGVVTAGLGQVIAWRGFSPMVTSGLQAHQHTVLVGTPSENPAIASLGGAVAQALAGGRWQHPVTRAALTDEEGIVAVVRHPQYADKAVLVVSGNTPKGVLTAARLLMQKPANKLLSGPIAVVSSANAGPAHPYRAWEGFVQSPGATSFHQLGLESLTTRGITGLPLFYKMRVMPDLYLPGKQFAKLKTVYSYASQLDASQSKLEVRWNGKALKSVPLDDPKGKTLAELELDVPTEDVHTFNDLEYVFHVYPEKYDLCRFVTDVHIWGTVHKTSSLVLPAEVKAPLPDIGLLNDAGYPFTAFSDLSQLAVVLPQTPNPQHLNLMLQALARLGRESQSKTGIQLLVHRASSLPGDVKNNRHLIAIGDESSNTLFQEVRPKMHLLVSGTTQTLSGPEAENAKKLAALQYTPDQGIVEELLSPWNHNRVVLLAGGPQASALEHVASLFRQDNRFGSIQPGNLLVVNGQGTKSIISLNQGDAKFLYPTDAQQANGLPLWAQVLVGLLALVGLVAVGRKLAGR
jgi:hypothetical protein